MLTAINVLIVTQIDEFLKTGTLRELEEGGGFQQPGAPPPAPTGDAAMALKFL